MTIHVDRKKDLFSVIGPQEERDRSTKSSINLMSSQYPGNKSSLSMEKPNMGLSEVVC